MPLLQGDSAAVACRVVSDILYSNVELLTDFDVDLHSGTPPLSLNKDSEALK